MTGAEESNGCRILPGICWLWLAAGGKHSRNCLGPTCVYVKGILDCGCSLRLLRKEQSSLRMTGPAAASLNACPPKDLDFHWAQAHANHVERPASERAVNFLHSHRSLRDAADRLRSLRRGLVAVQDVEGIAFRTQHDLHDEIELLRLGRIRVSGKHNFLIVENA